MVLQCLRAYLRKYSLGLPVQSTGPESAIKMRTKKTIQNKEKQLIINDAGFYDHSQALKFEIIAGSKSL